MAESVRWHTDRDHGLYGGPPIMDFALPAADVAGSSIGAAELTAGLACPDAWRFPINQLLSNMKIT
jgi:hypothetical protein